MTPDQTAAARSHAPAKAAIIAVGDELVLGQKLNTNSQWLADWLMDRGMRTVEHVTVDDDIDQIAGAIERLAGLCGLIVLTGGLGPTADDLTRQSLARVLGDELVEDGEALAHVRAWFEGRGRTMPPANKVQALRPASSRSLENAQGTAFGLAAELPDSTRVLCLPGPPHEMRPMAERELGEVLAQHDSTVRTRVIQTFGLGESTIADLIADLMARDRETMVGTTASTGVVSIRIRSENQGSAGDAERAIAEAEALVRDRLGHAVFGTGDDTLEAAIVAMLRERGQTLAVVESCTGGLLGEIVTSIAGSSDVFLGGWLTYSNEMKRSQVGVPADVIEQVGAVSRECAIAMAVGGRERSGADWTLSITGIAGPGGGSEFKPVGTVWIGLAGPDGPMARQFRFKGNREQVRLWSARSALGLLRLAMLEATMPLVGQMVD